MDDEIVLPHRMTVLGKAMASIESSLKAALDSRLSPSAPVTSMIEVAQQHFDILQANMQKLTNRVNALMTEIVNNETAIDGDVYRVVGRLEGVLEDLQSGYFDIQRLAAGGRDIEARDLLAGVYRHTLIEILAWIREIVTAMANPKEVLKSKGLSTEGNIQLNLALTLTPAPELEALTRWIARERVVAEAGSDSSSSRKTGWGFWTTMFAILAGWLIVKLLF